MKTSFATFVALMALPCASHAAPRLVVSTPSLAPESAIDLILDRPVTAAADLGKEVGNTWLEITPALPGKLVWKAQNIASFMPDQAPAIGTSYTFAIPKGKAHLDKTEIPAGIFATVASEPFTVRSANSENRYSSTYSASTAEWLLIFNDDVDPAKAGPFITFTSKTGQQVAAKLHRPDRARTGPQANYYKSWAARSKGVTEDPNPPLETPVANALVVAPLSPLPVGENWRLSILKGLPNAAGKAATVQDAPYEIGTIHPFTVSGFEARANPDEARRLVITFNAPLPSELPADFLTQSLVLEPRPENLTAEIDGREIHLLGDFSERETWNVTVRPPFASGAGIPLAAAVTKEVEFPVIEPELLLPSENQAQLSTGRRTYPIQTVNLEKLHIRIKRLSPEDLVRAYQGYRHYTGIGHNFDNIEPTAPLPYSLITGQTVYDKEIELDNAPDTSKEIELKWDEILPKDLKSGAIFLDVVGTPKADLNTEGRRNVQAIIQLTDIGLAWKLTPKEAFVYAFSCATGQPLKDVTIDLFGEDSANLNSLKTDANGLVTVARPAEARHLRAVLGNDSFVTAFDSSLNTVGLWHFPIRYSWNTPAESVRRAFLFTDRSLYRPGETVRLKGIVRTQAGNVIQPAAPANARIVVIDPTDKEIFTQPVTLSDTGSFDVTYKLPESNTGTHLIRLEFPDELAEAEALEDDWSKQQQIRESATFEMELAVEEFRRNAFEIEQGITRPATGATSVSSDVAASYYQGQAVAGGTLKHYTRITPLNPYPERFRDFLFGNHRSQDWGYWYHYFGYRSRYDDDDGNSGADSGPSTIQGEVTLSPEGKATITVDIPQAEFPTSREVKISTEVTDANNQTLNASATTTVHPASVYVGISRNDRLIRANENVAFRLVAIDPEGNPFPEPVKVTATLSREVNSAVRSQNANGDTVTRNDVREENVLVSEVTIDPAASAKEGQEFAVTPKDNGKYFLTLRGKDKDGRDFATVSSFHVYGSNDYPWLYEDGMRVKLIAEKKSYKAGETARVLVLSPIEGTALVTVEREKVLRSFLTPLKADNPVIEIPIGEDDAPNAYISVLIVKGAGESAREYKTPQLRLGYCELTIENQRDHLSVDLTAAGPESDRFTVATGPQKGTQLPAARPGDTVTLSGTVTTADGKPAAGAELTLYAEDEGTLAVMGYVTPDPMGFFYDARVLGIDAGVSFNHFMTEEPEYRQFFNKGFFIGGGADLGDLADLYRKNFDPCATWAPVVTAGPDGKFTHTFKVPDTLTRYRVIAVAHSAEKFGHAETGLVVNKPLMLEPKTARFANQGDSFSPQVLVQNASPHDGTWEVTFSTGRDGTTPVCRALGEATQTVTLNAGASATLSFPVTAESTGTSTFSWKAVPVSLGNGQLTPGLTRSLSDAVEETFEVHYPMPIIRQVKFVKLDKAQSLLEHIDPALLSGTGDVTLEFSRSPLTEISGSVDYLLQYPYGCVEQTTSSLMPWFAVEPLRNVIPAFAKVSDEKRKAAIQKGADRLVSMQLPDGSFTYWPGRSDRVDWASAYAGLGLLLAKENGAHVPQSAIDQLAKYLTESLRGIADVKSPSFLEDQARALWVLALAGSPQASYQSVLLDRIADLSPTGRAFLALAYNAGGSNPATAKSILTSKVPFRLKHDGWMRWNADDSIRLLAWSTIDPQSKETTTTLDRMIHERNPYGHWNTTWANGWGLLAMSTYAKNDKAALSGDWTAEMNPPLSSGTVTLNPENPTASATVAITPDLKLDINPKGTGYVRIKVASKPRIEPLQPVATNGLSVDRIYERIKADGSAEILTEPKVGDLIRVSLRVTLPNDDTKYLVVEDMLPSLFETVNTDFKTQGTGTGAGADVSTNKWEVSHSELRTDRAVFFLDRVWKKGTYTLTYLARCTVPGVATAPPAKAEGMYDPEFYALSASRVFTTK
ncbi:MAG: hypothetical protein KF712_05465 [Akkermansiaceae bacterium]|nr:hypothetical protein [Akkermansiaceae bacterium]